MTTKIPKFVKDDAKKLFLEVEQSLEDSSHPFREVFTVAELKRWRLLNKLTFLLNEAFTKHGRSFALTGETGLLK